LQVGMLNNDVSRVKPFKKIMHKNGANAYICACKINARARHDPWSTGSFDDPYQPQCISFARTVPICWWWKRDLRASDLPATPAPTSKTSIGRYELLYQQIPRSTLTLVYPEIIMCQVSSCKYPRLKEVDDVLGGAAAWENVDTTDGELVL
jgi:hypothetical protein